MQSNGGAIAAAEAPGHAISTVGSVLTGGVVGAVALGEQLGHRNIIATDVGGTTFLVGLVVDGEPVRASTTIINHHPINVPTLEVHAIGSGGGAIAWIDAGGNLRVGPHSAQAVPGPGVLRHRAAPSRPTPTRTWCSASCPRRGLLGGRKPLDVEELARSDPDAHRRAARPDRRGRGRRDLRRAERPDRRPAAQDRRRGRPRSARRSWSTPSAVPARRTAPRTRREVGVGEVVVPLGPVASAFSAYGLAASDIVLAAELSDPAPMPFDPARAEQQLRATRDAGAASARAAGAEVRPASSSTARSTCATRCSSPRCRRPCRPARSTPPRSTHASDAFEQRYAELYGEGTGFRAAGIQAITFRVRAVGVLPFSPGAARDRRRRRHPTRRGAQLGRARCASTHARLRRHRDLRLSRAARRARDRPGPPSSRSRRPPSSCPTAWPARVDRLGNLSIRHPGGGPDHDACPFPARRCSPAARSTPTQLRAALPAALPVHTVTPGADRRPRPAHLRGRSGTGCGRSPRRWARRSSACPGRRSSPTPTTSTSRSATRSARRCRSACTTRCSSARSTWRSTGRCSTGRRIPASREGDMFLCNDPWVGGGLHQSDVIVFQPIFHDGKLFAWTSAICHEPDLGGVGLGSFCPAAQDVFSESLPTPPIKVVRDFELQRDVADDVGAPLARADARRPRPARKGRRQQRRPQPAARRRSTSTAPTPSRP